MASPLFPHNIWISESVNPLTLGKEWEIRRPTFSRRISNSCPIDENKDPSTKKERNHAPNLKKKNIFLFFFRNNILFTYFGQNLPFPRICFVWIFLSPDTHYQLQLSKVSFFLYFTKSFHKKKKFNYNPLESQLSYLEFFSGSSNFIQPCLGDQWTVVEDTGAFKQINLYNNLSCTSKKLVVMGESYHPFSLKKQNWEDNYCDRELLGGTEPLVSMCLAWSWQIFGDNYETFGKKEILILWVSRQEFRNGGGGEEVRGKKNMLVFTRRKYSKQWWE